jgi:chromosome partitioning protein
VVALCRTGGETEEGAARGYLQKAKYEVLTTTLPERLTYREAMNRGEALTEIIDKTLNARAQALIDELVKKVRAEVAARASRRRTEQAG